MFPHFSFFFNIQNICPVMACCHSEVCFVGGRYAPSLTLTVYLVLVLFMHTDGETEEEDKNWVVVVMTVSTIWVICSTDIPNS